MDKICDGNYIWDLHIHTCLSKGSSGDFSNFTEDKYIEEICKVFKKHNDLKMISFTDHNEIHTSIYSKFNNKNTGIKLIPGIEVDVYLDDAGEKAKQAKHVLFYFNPDSFNLDEDSKKINDFLANGVPKIFEFLKFLLNLNVPFIISPHFLKQDKRGIEFHWPPEEEFKKNLEKYIDQWFSFLETSGISTITKAIEVLKEFDCDKKISIVSFSDSSSIKKLESYLDNPPQYFSALPCFDGMRMVGSDYRRISKNKEFLSNADKGSYLKTIKINGKDIILSTGLNCIIGGRGSGKSVLLDLVSSNLGYSSEMPSTRKDFISSIDAKVFDYNDNSLIGHKFAIDYYNQGFVSQLFNSKTKPSQYQYFKDEFSKINIASIEEIKAYFVENLKFKAKTNIEQKDNLSNVSESILKMISDTKKLIIERNDIISTIGYKQVDEINTRINSILDENICDDEEVQKELNKFLKLISSKINSYNQTKAITSKALNNIFVKYDEIFACKNKVNRLRTKSLKLLQNSIYNSSFQYSNKVNLINKYIKLQKMKRNKYEDSVSYKTLNDNTIIFKKVAEIEEPFEYLHRILASSIRTSCFREKDDIKKLDKLVSTFCLSDDSILLDGKSSSEIIEKLSSFSDLKIEIKDKICFISKGKEIDLDAVSPGFRANILLEYIISKDTHIPLLIDQPEDNIDNKTIYSELTSWFSSLKKNKTNISCNS